MTLLEAYSRISERLRQSCKRAWIRLQLRRSLVDLAETFWPVLKGNPENPWEVDVEWICANLRSEKDPGKIEEIYALAKAVAKAEEERNDTITRKTTAVFGATGIISAVVLGLGRFILLDVLPSRPTLVAVISMIYVATLLYLARAVHFSLKALKKAPFWVVSAKDICIGQDKPKADYLKSVAGTLLEYTERNYRVTNDRVDSFEMARKYLRLALWALVAIGVFIAAYSTVASIVGQGKAQRCLHH